MSNLLRKSLHLRQNFVSFSRFSASATSTASLNFDNGQYIYQYQPIKNLLRSYVILRTCSLNIFVDNALNLMNVTRKTLGTRIFDFVVRPTFYRQFVGGDSELELQVTVEGLTKAGVRLMVCPVQEEDIDDSPTSESKYDENLEYIKNTAEIMAKCTQETPNLQLKITAFMPAQAVVNICKLIQEAKNCNEMKYKIVNDFTEFFKNNSMEFTADWTKQLDDNDLRDIYKGLKRIQELSDFSISQGLKLLVDAEYTYMNDGISAVALAMMCHYNQNKAVVGNTYQCYLKATYDTVEADYNFITQRSKFGAKIVRGAYLEKERKLAKMQNYSDPVNDTYEDTGKMYGKVVSYLLQKAKSDDLYMVIATHNETAVQNAVSELANTSDTIGFNKVVFAQIYGMGEQITMPLANEGYTVYKSVPYGTMEEVLPYLSRRVAENRSVLAGARKERQLLSSEIRRRILRLRQ